MPDFLIAPEGETKGVFFSKPWLDVEGLLRVQQAQDSKGHAYGLWARGPAAGELAGLQAFMDQIIGLGPKVLGLSALYSLVSDGQSYFLSLRNTRDLFRIGGLLAGDGAVMRDIRKASEELAYPINPVTEVLRAEEALFAAR